VPLREGLSSSSTRRSHCSRSGDCDGHDWTGIVIVVNCQLRCDDRSGVGQVALVLVVVGLAVEVIYISDGEGCFINGQ
jgi:hypothetical protein